MHYKRRHAITMARLLTNDTISRRELFQNVGLGIGSIALGSILARDLGGAETLSDIERDAVAPRTHFPARAKHVIFLHMVGAPSQLDLFDYKPVLQKHDGQLLPDDLWEGLRLAFIRQQPKLLGTSFKFKRHGQCDTELSELLPHLAQVIDDVAVVKSLHTEQFNHAPAQLFMQTGFARFGRPCLGS